jgi:hypothetical protein
MMFKSSQLLPNFPYVELYLNDGRKVDLCKALMYRDARLYHISHLGPDGTQILDQPKWFVEFKKERNTQAIEIYQDMAEEIAKECNAKIETFEDGAFWF